MFYEAAQFSLQAKLPQSNGRTIMTNCFTKFISFLLIPAAMLVLSYPLQAEAKGKKGGFEASLVPVGEPTFTDGAIRIKAKGGRVKGGLRNVDFPVETSGVFVITLMVNDGESVDVELPFEVREGDDEGEDGEAPNFVKLKVSLQEELELENGDIVKVLSVQVKMAVDEELTPIATLGFAFGAKERKGGDLEPTEPEEPETSATRNDFVGVWEGAVEFEDEGETKTAVGANKRDG